MNRIYNRYLVVYISLIIDIIYSFKYSQKGVTAIEYAIVVGCVAVSTVAIFSDNGQVMTMLTGIFDKTRDKIIALL
ncbi:Flp family type IVb pilin [Enterobacteriaceae bacterium ESL0689]|nr:Flp family type IVb pilin [Enterobacteriaceae bacterium ESL0689]